MKLEHEQLFVSNDDSRRKVSPDYSLINRSQYNPPYTTSPAPPHHSGSYDLKAVKNKEPPREQALVDWANSFNDPYCLLVNSFQDLQDGIALCHLVGYIACSQADQEKIKQLVYYDASSQEFALQNLDLAINILKSSSLPIPPQVQ